MAACFMSYFRLFLALVMAGAWLPAEQHGFLVIVLDEVSEKGDRELSK